VGTAARPIWSDTSRAALVLAFAVVTPAAYPLHELGHWIAFRLVGIPAAISLDHTYFTVAWEPSLAGAAGGPLASVALAWLGVVLLVRGGRLEPLGLALAVVMPLTRLSTYALCAAVPRAMAVNDEGVMALHLGWPTWSCACILLPGLLAPWAVAWHALHPPPRRKLAVFGGSVAAWIALVLVLELGVLEPRLFPHAAARELVMPRAPR
jgi:hypothetical protein